MAPKAYRWVPEMREISTLGAAGITPKVFDGVADICAFVSGTELGQESVERHRKAGRSGNDAVRLLAGSRRR